MWADASQATGGDGATVVERLPVDWKAQGVLAYNSYSPRGCYNNGYARESVWDLHRSATLVGMSALTACPTEATMRFVLKFGHQLQLLYGLARGRPVSAAEQPGNQPTGPKPVTPPSKLKPKPSPQGSRPKDHEGIAPSGPKTRPLAETLVFL